MRKWFISGSLRSKFRGSAISLSLFRSLLLFQRNVVVYWPTSVNIYAITREHALSEIFIISEGINPLDIYAKCSLVPLFFTFPSHFLYLRYPIRSYNGAMSTSQTENIAGNLRSILMEFRLNFRTCRTLSHC